MTPDERFRRYQDLQRYVGWTDDDARNVRSAADLLDPHLVALIDDFYAEIERHPDARKVITGGATQIARLKGTLRAWLRELLAGPYDLGYVERRWRVGWRHFEIGLDQVYTNAALSRLRRGLLDTLTPVWPGDPRDSLPVRRSLNTLFDLDLAIIEDVYQAEYLNRRRRAERLAAIGQVGGGVAHELRNQLNVIETSVYYLLHARNPTDEKRAEHLKRIERHVVLADGVITALSNFARMPLPDLKAVPVRRVVEEAVELNPPPAGVALLDFKMPGMEGLELYRRIKAERAGTVAIIASAYTNAATRQHALGAGAWQVLPKPVDFPKLLGLVDEALGQPLVLVVDDDPDVSQTLWDLLRERGYRVCLAHSVPPRGGRLRPQADQPG